jgi:hypothetical protein
MAKYHCGGLLTYSGLPQVDQDKSPHIYGENFAVSASQAENISVDFMAVGEKCINFDRLHLAILREDQRVRKPKC